MNNKQKGDLLENAIISIEELIYRLEPKIDILKMEIYKNFRKSILGVSYEIDVYKKSISNDKSSIILFECKNWDKKKVPAKEIIYFMEKITDLEAECGYFVASQFTRSAQRKAKQYPKIELLEMKINLCLRSTNWVTFMPSHKHSYLKYQLFNFKNKISINLHSEIIIKGIVKRQESILHYLTNAAFTLFPKGCQHRCCTYLKDIVNPQFIDIQREEILVDGVLATTAYIEGVLYTRVNPEKLIADYSIPGKGRYIVTETIPETPKEITLRMAITSAEER